MAESWRVRPTYPRTGWVIWDKESGKRYLPRIWESQEEAAYELAVLLRGYSPKSPWRRALVVQHTEVRK